MAFALGDVFLKNIVHQGAQKRQCYHNQMFFLARFTARRSFVQVQYRVVTSCLYRSELAPKQFRIFITEGASCSFVPIRKQSRLGGGYGRRRFLK